MSLRRRAATSGTKATLSVRLPVPVRAYITKTAERDAVTETQVVKEAILLERDLSTKLSGYERKIEVFADQEGLVYEEELAEVLARLVKLGLDGSLRKAGE